MSVDPDLDVTGQPYEYAGDNPVDEVDPFGLNPFSGTWHRFANGFDIARHGVAVANDWLNTQANAAVCRDLPGPNWGSLAGWLQTESGCGNASPNGQCTTTLAAITVWDTSGLPPLNVLHPKSTLESDPSLQYWSQQQTDAIVRSRYPGQDNPLLVGPDGTIRDGNTRVTILQDRGYDVNSLPREIWAPGEVPLLRDDFFEGG